MFKRQQRAILNGRKCEWMAVKVVVPQSSIVGLFFGGFFLMHINDLSDTLDSNIKPIADDTSMFLVANEPDATSVKLNKDFDHVRL